MAIESLITSTISGAGHHKDNYHTQLIVAGYIGSKEVQTTEVDKTSKQSYFLTEHGEKVTNALSGQEY